MIENRRRMMMTKRAGGDIPLPEGYKKYDWIASDGIAYVDTLIKPTFDMKWHFKLGLTQRVYHTEELGSIRNNSERFHFGQVGWNCDIGIGTQTGGSFRFDTVALPILVDMYGNGKLVKDGEVTQIGTGLASNLSVSITLFGRHVSGTKIEYIGTAFKIYEHSIAVDGVIIQDFIPCTNPDGNAGFYDTISETFYGNAKSSGALIAGND